MAEKGKVFNFIIGLKPWARNEVNMEKIKILEEAFVAGDCLVEHYDEGSKEKKKKFDKQKGNSTKEEHSRSNDKLKMKKPLQCWLCEENNTLNNCPSRPTMVVVAQADSKKKKEDAVVGVMQILGVAVAMEVVPR